MVVFVAAILDIDQISYPSGAAHWHPNGVFVFVEI